MVESRVVKSQYTDTPWKEYREDGRRYRIRVHLRYDDTCGNRHNSFAITGTIQEVAHGRWAEYMGGCCHTEIAAHFPELAPYIKWHLCLSDGPMHYIPNTVYAAGNRDYNGLLKGERRQIVNRTRQPCWHLVAIDPEGNEVPVYTLNHLSADGEKPETQYRVEWRSWDRVGEGKERDLEAARATAVWPEATDEDLTVPGLEDRLKARLPALLEEFKKDMEALGFVW